MARFVDVNLHLCLDIPGESSEQWQPLIDSSGDRVDFAARYGKADEAGVIQFLTFDRENPNSIRCPSRTCPHLSHLSGMWSPCLSRIGRTYALSPLRNGQGLVGYVGHDRTRTQVVKWYNEGEGMRSEPNNPERTWRGYRIRRPAFASLFTPDT